MSHWGFPGAVEFSLQDREQFWEAVEANAVDTVRSLLASKKVLSNTVKDGFSPLQVACLKNLPELVAVLVDANRFANSRQTADGKFPIQLSSSIAVWRILAPQCSRNTRDLWEAIEKGDGMGARVHLAAVADEELEAKVNEPKCLKLGETDLEVSLLHVAAFTGNADIIRILLASGALVNKPDQAGTPPLLYAAEHGHVESVRTLLDNGAEFDAKDHRGFTSLHWAATRGDEEMAVLLLDKGADINIKDSDGAAPIHVASRNGRVELVRLLLSRGADVMARTNDGLSPLHEAASYGNPAIAGLLLESGAVLDDTETAAAESPLFRAVERGNLEVIKLLLEKGANVNGVDKKGQTPVHIASYGGYLAVLTHLLETGGEADAADNHGRSPLHHAATNGKVEVVRLLLEKGVEKNCKDKFAATPFDLAAQAGWIDVVHFLREKGGAASNDSNVELAQDLDRYWNAVKCYDVETIRSILTSRSFFASSQKGGISGLHVACRDNHLEA
ncbi:hypothetical protein HDU96_001339, partial [Phlyctochytrium bullatum]